MDQHGNLSATGVCVVLALLAGVVGISAAITEAIKPSEAQIEQAHKTAHVLNCALLGVCAELEKDSQ